MCYANKKEIMFYPLGRHFPGSIMTDFAPFFAHMCYAKRTLPLGTYHLSSLSTVLKADCDARSEDFSTTPKKRASVSSGLLLPRRTARHPLELPRVLPRHARFIPGAFAAFPEAVAFLADETGVAEAAVFGAVVLLAGACEGGGFG